MLSLPVPSVFYYHALLLFSTVDHYHYTRGRELGITIKNNKADLAAISIWCCRKTIPHVQSTQHWLCDFYPVSDTAITARIARRLELCNSCRNNNNVFFFSHIAHYIGAHSPSQSKEEKYSRSKLA